jgi:hypothetical protein
VTDWALHKINAIKHAACEREKKTTGTEFPLRPGEYEGPFNENKFSFSPQQIPTANITARTQL